MSKKKPIVIAVALVALVALYYTTPLSRALGALRSPLLALGAPIFGATSAAREWGGGVFGGSELAQRLARQEQTIAQLSYAVARETGVSPTDAAAPLSEVTIAGRVVALNALGGSRTLLVDAGRSSGVVEGSAVATPQGVFVGKVVRVYDDVSLVLPLASSRSAIAAHVSRDSRIQAVVRGLGGLGLTMELIPQDADIRESDVVVTSLLEENTPVGLLLGTVAAVSYTEGDLFKKAVLAPFVSLHQISRVRMFVPRPE